MTNIRAVPSSVDIQSSASPAISGTESVSRKSSRSSPKQKNVRGIEQTPMSPRRNIQQRLRPTLMPKGQTDAELPVSGNHELRYELSIVPIGHVQAGSIDASCGGQTDARDQDKPFRHLIKGPRKISLDQDAHPDQRKAISSGSGTYTLPGKYSATSTVGRFEYDEHITKIIGTIKVSSNYPFALTQRRPAQARLDSINRWSSSLDLQDVRESLLAADSNTSELISELTPNLRALLPLLLLNLRAPSNFTKQSIEAAVNFVQRSARQRFFAEIIYS